MEFSLIAQCIVVIALSFLLNIFQHHIILKMKNRLNYEILQKKSAQDTLREAIEFYNSRDKNQSIGSCQGCVYAMGKSTEVPCTACYEVPGRPKYKKRMNVRPIRRTA
jgi:hypothetical protein